MAKAKFEYDESGGTSLYFLVSFYILFLIPLTYYLWPSKPKKEDPDKLKRQCHCDPCEDKRSLLTSPDAGKKLKSVLRWCTLIIAWIIFIFIAVKASQVERDHVEYDPFDILEIERGATDKEIRKQYRSLSLQYHPDKEGGDERRFMKIAKAYAALTDKESRKNWEEFGNPDGPQATEFGIALPAWIVDQKNSVWVLAAYILAFIVILPIGVGTWWYRSIRYSAEEILMDTTRIFLHYIYKTPAMNSKRAVMILSGAYEFNKSHNSQIVDRPSDDEELSRLVKEFGSKIGMRNKERPFYYPYSRKARLLIYAQQARTELPLDTLYQDKLYLVTKCPALVQEMVNTAIQITTWCRYRGPADRKRCPRLDSVESFMKLSPMLVQAIDEKTTLLQLPHFDDEILRMCQSKKRHIKNLSHFARISHRERSYILSDLSEHQYLDVINVCSSMPVITSEITFQVVDDEDTEKITAGAIVTATILLKRSSLEVNNEEEDTSQLNGIAGNPELAAPDHEDQTNSPAAQIKKTTFKKNKKNKKKNNPFGATAGVAQQNKAKLKAIKKKQRKKEEAAAAAAAAATAAAEAATTAATAAVNEEEDAAESDRNSGNEETRSEEIHQNADSEEENNPEDDAKDSVSEGNSDGDTDSDDDQWEELQAKAPRKEKVLEGRSKESHQVHAPYYPEVKQEWWWVYIADRKAMTFITMPTMVYDLEEEKEIQLQFPAPAKGTHSYTLCVRSDSYMDCDHFNQFKLDVAEAKKVVESHPQWEDSDEEERDESAVSDSGTDDEFSDSEEE